jgi:uncharacterized membrane protein SpoIIM required for sporulation
MMASPATDPTPDTGLMRSARFRAEREAHWRRLEALVSATEARGVRTLSFDEARDLATLYRQAANSLSVARAISLDRSLLDYLEALTARAYLAVYAPQQSLGGLFGRFFFGGASAAVRRSVGYILLGFITMALGAAAGYLLFFENADWYDVFVPSSMGDTRGVESTRQDLFDVIYASDDAALEELGVFASFLFSHNTQIAIFAFALGVFVCLPSFLLVFYNGLLLGAFFALHVDRGIGWDLFGWLSIHGVTELSAVAISAGAGFRLGGAVLFPGQRTRRDALRDEGHDAVKVALVAAFMLFVAAILEGFGRQLITDIGARIVIGWGVGALWLAWFALAGRRT